MAAPLVEAVAAWLSALATGASGSGFVVTPGTFHSDRFAVETGEAGDPEITVDRRVEARYVTGALRPFAGSCRRAPIAFELRVGYRFDIDIAEVGADAGEARTTLARNRAGSDGAYLREVLLDPSNWGAVGSVARVEAVEVGDHSIADGSEGALLGVLPVSVVVSYTRADLALATAAT